MKENKHILILSPFFYPEPISTGKYNTDLVKELVKEGHKLTVVCSHPIYPEWKVNCSNKILKGVEIIRGGKYMWYPNNNFLRRIVLEIWFAFFSVFKILQLRKKVDVIISVFPPSLFSLFIYPFLSRQTKKIGIVHDLQYVFIKGSGNIFKKIIAFLIKSVEKFTLKKCDKLIVLSNEMKDSILKNYQIDRKKIVVQYPFVNLDKSVTDELGYLFHQDYKHIVYSGALGDKQNPDGLFSFANYVCDSISNVQFHFFSSGSIFERLKINNQNKNIMFHDLVPFINVRELYKRSDIQIIPQKTGTSEGSLPSKLPNILDAGCKILLITDKKSELHKLFNDYKIGEVVTDWENEKLLDSLSNLLYNSKYNSKLSKDIVDKLFSLDSLVRKIL